MKHSIRIKIWRNQLFTIVIFGTLLILANFTILNVINEEFIYEQLEDAANERLELSNTDAYDEDYFLDDSSFIPHFAIFWNGKDTRYKVDNYTGTALEALKSDSIIESIASDINGYSNESIKGSVVSRAQTIYYLATPIDKHTTIVFFNTSKGVSFFSKEYLLIGLALLVVGFFTSAYLSKKITKPIKALEVFAEQISKRNFDAKPPETDTREIHELATSLDHMRSSLKSLDERDRKFLQSASHDLKTPVMIIKGYAQAMNEGIDISSDKSSSEVILEETTRLERRITQLLRLNTIDHTLEQQSSREPIRIDRLLRNLVNRFSVVDNELIWSLDDGAFEIIGSSDALMIAFENLLENQLRYAESYIKISITSGDRNKVVIENDGPHFREQNTQVLFDPYLKSEDGNFGLGLAIVKQVIESHGGTVEACNTDTGVKFTITL